MTAKFVVEYGKDTPSADDDGRLDAPAFHRNAEPILAVVTRVLGAQQGHVIEIGSGTGQHIMAFAGALPRLTWWPSDPNDAHRRSIEAWRRKSGYSNVLAPVVIDAARADWPLGQAGFPPANGLSGIVCINVLHIAPWSVAEGLFAAARRHLAPEGRLVLYGPYAVGGTHTAESNVAFDASLRARNPEWGVRDTVDSIALAMANRLGLVETVAMPANNLMLIVGRASG